MTPSPHPSAEAHELEHGGELGELGVQGSTYVRLPRGVRWVHGVDLQAAGELLPAPGVVHTILHGPPLHLTLLGRFLTLPPL